LISFLRDKKINGTAIPKKGIAARRRNKNYSVGGPLRPVKRRSIRYPTVSLFMNTESPGESLSFSMKLIFVNDLSK